ncbi:MAG: Rieske (2Fe-2S) protein [Chitinophagales bacterium]|nr:Rieske (2Fe-2S) protein [Chitinophagales bacterium]
MNRRKFITTGCISCISGGLMMSLIEGCTTAKIATITIEGSDMIVPLAAFRIKKSNQTSYKQYLVVQNDKLKYPICVFRFDENHYEALLMRCTHQGTELQVFGDKLQCPAHGSEFNNRGDVKHGPAATALRKFPVTITNNQLKISLI